MGDNQNSRKECLTPDTTTSVGTRIGLPAASWMLEIGTIFLRTETDLVLKSRRVIPGRLVEAGFRFQFPEWVSAAQNLVDRWRATYSLKSG